MQQDLGGQQWPDSEHKEEGAPLNQGVSRSGLPASIFFVQESNDFSEAMNSLNQPGVFQEKEKVAEEEEEEEQEEVDHDQRIFKVEKINQDHEQRLQALEQYVVQSLSTEIENHFEAKFQQFSAEVANVFEGLFQLKAKQFNCELVHFEEKISELSGEVSFDRLQLDNLKAETEKLAFATGAAVEKLRGDFVLLQQNDQEMCDLRGESAIFLEQVGQIKNEITQRCEQFQREIDFRFDRVQQNIDQHIDRRVNRCLLTTEDQLRSSETSQRPEINQSFQSLQNQFAMLHHEVVEMKEVTAKNLQEAQDFSAAQRAAHHNLTDQVGLHIQQLGDRVEQIFQQAKVDRSDQMLLWNQLDQSEKQFRQSILEMQATYKNEMARNIRSVAEELGAIDRKNQTDRFIDRETVQDLTEQLKALKKTVEELKMQNMVSLTVKPFPFSNSSAKMEPTSTNLMPAVSSGFLGKISDGISTNLFPMSTEAGPNILPTVPNVTKRTSFVDGLGSFAANLLGQGIFAAGSNSSAAQSVTSQVSTTTNPTPISSGQEPMTTSPTPIAAGQVSMATSQVPMMASSTLISTSSTPIATSPTPITTNPTPIRTSPTPITTSPTPITTNPTPITTSPTPITTNPTPIRTSPTPITTSPTPIMTSSTPITTCKMHNVPSQSLNLPSQVMNMANQAPILASLGSITTESRPIVASPGLQMSNQALNLSSQAPNLPDQAPSLSNAGLFVTNQVPNVVVPEPSVLRQVPAICVPFLTENPLIVGETKPSGMNQIPVPCVQSLVLTVKSRPKGNDSELLRPNVSKPTSFQFQVPVPVFPTMPNPTGITVNVRPIGIQPASVPSNSDQVPVPPPQPVFLGSQSAAIIRAESAKPRKFSGLARDFRAFERDLEVYFSRWTSVQEGSLTDRMKLDILEEVTDEATAKTVREWRATDPGMDFPMAWRKVRKLFGEAVTGGARQEWRALRFEFSGKASTSVVAWRNFSADFARLRKEVPDCSEGEAIEFLRERLPHSLLSEINKEETVRRKRNGAVVRLVGLLPLPENTVTQLLISEGVTGLQHIRMADGGHEAVMTDYVEAESLVARINGLVVECGGTTSTVSARRLGSSMTATEIIDHLTDFLTATARVDEEAKRGFYARESTTVPRDRRFGRGREVDAVSTSDEAPALSETAPATPRAGGGDSRTASKGGDGKVSARERSPGANSGGQRRSPSVSGRKPTPQRRPSGNPENQARFDSAECYFCGEVGHIQRDCPLRPAFSQGSRFPSQKFRTSRPRGRSSTPSGRVPKPQEVRQDPAMTVSTSAQSAQGGSRGGGSGPEAPQPRSQ